jgi:hypothetical protein
MGIEGLHGGEQADDGHPPGGRATGGDGHH